MNIKNDSTKRQVFNALENVASRCNRSLGYAARNPERKIQESQIIMLDCIELMRALFDDGHQLNATTIDNLQAMIDEQKKLIGYN